MVFRYGDKKAAWVWVRNIDFTAGNGIAFRTNRNEENGPRTLADAIGTAGPETSNSLAPTIEKELPVLRHDSPTPGREYE
jgi:hypothetical protein